MLIGPFGQLLFLMVYPAHKHIHQGNGNDEVFQTQILHPKMDWKINKYKNIINNNSKWTID